MNTEWSNHALNRANELYPNDKVLCALWYFGYKDGFLNEICRSNIGGKIYNEGYDVGKKDATEQV